MVRYSVLVKPSAKKDEILSSEEGMYHISLKAPPEDNKANIALVKFLSKHLKKQVRIVSGFTSKKKIIEIL